MPEITDRININDLKKERDRRAHPRIPVQYPVRVALGSVELFKGTVRNLSRGGLMVDIFAPTLPGHCHILSKKLDVVITVPVPPGVLTCRGAVIWVCESNQHQDGPRKSFGVQITDLDTSQASVLGGLVDELIESLGLIAPAP